MHLQDRAGGDLSDFYNVYLRFIGALNQRPEIAMAYSTFNINFPQYVVDVDAAKAKRAGVSPNVVLSTLAGFYGGLVRVEHQPVLEDVLCHDAG